MDTFNGIHNPAIPLNKDEEFLYMQDDERLVLNICHSERREESAFIISIVTSVTSKKPSSS